MILNRTSFTIKFITFVTSRNLAKFVCGLAKNLANPVGLRARSSSLKPDFDDDEEEDSHRRPWRRRLFSSMAFLTSASTFRISLFLLLLAAIVFACIFLPVEKILKSFLIWVKQDLGPWGPLVLAIAYIPLTVLAVPASVLTSFTRTREAIIAASNMIADKLGGGYLFGLPVGFVADSIGATIGATSAFLLGRTIGRSYVILKLNNYPKFQAVAVAVERSGFKIVLLLRLVPLLPFNMLNYLLSVTPVRLGEYILASWLGMMPITFALVYIGTTLKDLSDVTHGWGEISTTRWIFIASGFVISVFLLAYITKVAKASLDKALEGAGKEGILASPGLPVVAEPPLDLQNHVIIKIDSAGVDHPV